MNFIGNTARPFTPGLLNNYAFRSEQKLGQSFALTIGTATVLELLITLLTLPAYGRVYRRMQQANHAGAVENARSDSAGMELSPLSPSAIPG
ncbi:MAG TPA: hypothetical protein VG297_23470 [Bryobacteraceae bacterium]|nr:hypothetical protein [Bryobacteraceae bacterium]